jgi:hypothetical protein
MCEVVLEFELRASHLLSRHSTIKPRLQTLWQVFNKLIWQQTPNLNRCKVLHVIFIPLNVRALHFIIKMLVFMEGINLFKVHCMHIEIFTTWLLCTINDYWNNFKNDCTPWKKKRNIRIWLLGTGLIPLGYYIIDDAYHIILIKPEKFGVTKYFRLQKFWLIDCRTVSTMGTFLLLWTFRSISDRTSITKKKNNTYSSLKKTKTVLS